MHEVVVQRRIDDTDQSLLNAIPNIVDGHKLVADLQVGWHPDADDGYVDEDEKRKSAPFDAENCCSIHGKNSNTVDDDLHKGVDLQAP